MKKKDSKRSIYRYGIISIIADGVLTIGKIIAGILASSSSLVSDGVHSASDIISTIIVLIGAKISLKAADKEHPFGHERLESIASIILAMILVGTAFILGFNGIKAIIEFAQGQIPKQTGFVFLALGFAIASIVVKFIMFLYAYIVSKKTKSTSLKADAFHHLSDSLSSIGSVLGVVGIMLGGGWYILDPIASLLIALLIVKVAIDIAREAINQVVDKKAPEPFENQVKEIIKAHEGVKKINSLRTRQFGNKYYVELAIAVDSFISVKQGHDIATKVHDDLEKHLDELKHCVIHIEPYNEKNNLPK